MALDVVVKEVGTGTGIGGILSSLVRNQANPHRGVLKKITSKGLYSIFKVKGVVVQKILKDVNIGVINANGKNTGAKIPNVTSIKITTDSI